jgi:hypothetical protein
MEDLSDFVDGFSACELNNVLLAGCDSKNEPHWKVYRSHLKKFRLMGKKGITRMINEEIRDEGLELGPKSKKTVKDIF